MRLARRAEVVNCLAACLNIVGAVSGSGAVILSCPTPVPLRPCKSSSLIIPRCKHPANGDGACSELASATGGEEPLRGGESGISLAEFATDSAGKMPPRRSTRRLRRSSWDRPLKRWEGSVQVPYKRRRNRKKRKARSQVGLLLLFYIKWTSIKWKILKYKCL